MKDLQLRPACISLKESDGFAEAGFGEECANPVNPIKYRQNPKYSSRINWPRSPSCCDAGFKQALCPSSGITPANNQSPLPRCGIVKKEWQANKTKTPRQIKGLFTCP